MSWGQWWVCSSPVSLTFIFMEILKSLSGQKGNGGIVRSDGYFKKGCELGDGKNAVTKQC